MLTATRTSFACVFIAGSVSQCGLRREADDYCCSLALRLGEKARMLSLTRRTLLCSGAATVASAFLSGSTTALAAALADASFPPHERMLLDFGWKFFQGHASDPHRDLGFGAGQGDFAKSGSFDFATEKFDDSKWRSLNLPHDWAVELPFVHDEALQGHGYKPLGRRYPETSVGWYRKCD